jgi:hypothetical protein
MTLSQSRDLIFRTKNSCFQSYGIRLGSMLSIDLQMIPKWTATISWQIYLFIYLEQMIFLWRRESHEKRLVVSVDNYSVHTSRGSIDWLKKHSIHHIPDQIYLHNLATSYLYLFSTVKEKLERIHLADEDQFFECLRGFLRGLDQQELNRVFQAWVLRVQEVSEGNRCYVGW